ncbi:hypothetical protein QYM36_002733 [Artemia franciscana]|uniref:C3H1-type domain-containing protein n=1 Tax=Artemia franciscana TaxID=6661 RepID=A0AA88I999_ARTSF|nr:hypothetical protein QYM36_002733 [Artemia franciscana]
MTSKDFDEEALLADDCELISHETLQQYVNDLGLLGEDMFEPDLPEESQQKIQEELKPEKRKLEKILNVECNNEQAIRPLKPEHKEMSIKNLLDLGFLAKSSFNSNYKEREKHCISKENSELVQQIKCVPTKKKSIVSVSDGKPDIKSRKSESTNTQAYFQGRNKFVSSSNLLTPSPAIVTQELVHKKWTPIVWNSNDSAETDKKRNTSSSRQPCRYGQRCHYRSKCKFAH